MKTVNEEVKQVHRVMVTVSDPNHTMQTQRKTKIMKRVKVTANDKDHAIDSAIHHYKKAGYKVHDHEYLGRIHEAYNDYHNNRTGFGKRPREDDEYHVPDPVTTTHKIVHRVSHPDVNGGEPHNREVTISNTTKTKAQAHAATKTHLQNKGYTIHEQTVNEGAYEKAEENKKSADAAKEQGDMFAHHLHMADHHDNLAQWHGEKGRHGEADRHAEKAEKHHEEAMKLKESLEEARKANTASARAGLAARGRKEPSEAEKAEKKKSSDEAWERLMAYAAAQKKTNEEVACNNVGNGNIAGTQGDAGKKAVMTKEPLKRKSFNAMREECNCWKGYKRKPGTKPCEKGSCVKEESELDEAAIDAKGHKSSTGGLTQKGRDYYNNKTGGNLQAPVTTPPSKLDPDSKAAKRRKSFCARMSGVDGPMKDEKGRPTRKALALRKWNC